MNPFLKTFLFQIAGAAGAAIVAALDHPTGGLASTIANHPEVAIAYVALSQLAHTAYDHYLGGANASSTTPKT